MRIYLFWMYVFENQLVFLPKSNVRVKSYIRVYYHLKIH